MDLSNTKDLSNTCRVCLEKSLKLYPLEGPILNVDVHISTMISYCTSIEVVLDEDLPKGVCLPCFKTIRIAYNFIKQFKETNERLLAEREVNKNKYLQNSEEECSVEDIQSINEEELVGEQSDTYVDDISVHSLNENDFEQEEKIIITYVKDNNPSDHESTSAEIQEINDEIILEDEDPLKGDSDQLSKRKMLVNKHTCPVCFKMFPDFKRGVIKHLYHDHANTTFKCNNCSLDIDLTTEMYIQHYTKTHLYKCLVCNKKFRSKSSLYYHSRSHFEGGSYHCPHEECGKVFETIVSLRKHLPTHSNSAKYICSKCGKKFNTYDTFRYHNKTHDGKRNHLCNVCGRTFLQAVHLKDHMWHHTGTKQFRCTDCDKGYTSVTMLKKHRRKCGSLKPSEKSNKRQR